MELRRVPVFPLNTVLYPGGRLPLRVFEPRYHEMLSELLEDDADPVFMVALTDDPEVGVDARPRRVGCLARIIQVSPPAPVRFVLVEGTARCLAHDVHHDRAFAEADVAFLPEEAGRDAARVDRAFRRMIEPLLDELGLDGVAIPSEPCALSYLVANALPLGCDDRQLLLEAPDAASRLHLEARLLARLERKIRTAALARNARLN